MLAHVATAKDDICDGRHQDCPGETNVTPAPSSTDPPSITPPTSSPSAPPTSSPAPTASTSPTNTPTASSTASFRPTVNCASNDDGLFGFNGTEFITVEYAYQLDFDPSEGDDFGSIRLSLEDSFNDGLIQALFPNSCGTSNSSVLLRQASPVEIVGISRAPDDQAINDLECSAEEDSAECVIVQGLLTVYADTDTEDTQVQVTDQVDGFLKEGMKNGDFNSAHPSIVNVSYVDPDTIPSTTAKGPIGGGNTTTLVFSILGGIFGLVIMAILVVWNKKRGRGAEEGTTEEDLAGVSEGASVINNSDMNENASTLEDVSGEAV